MQEFYDLLKQSTNPDHDMRKEQVIETFLAFMVKKDKGKNRAYYENLYEESKSTGIVAENEEGSSCNISGGIPPSGGGELLS